MFDNFESSDEYWCSNCQEAKGESQINFRKKGAFCVICGCIVEKVYQSKAEIPI